MKRREFFNKTKVGVTGLIATGLGLVSFKGKGEAKEIDANRLQEKKWPGKNIDFNQLRKDFPPLNQFRSYMDTAFVGLMPQQVKKAHESFLNERFRFGPFASNKTILGVWMDKTEDVRLKLANFLNARIEEIAFTYCTGCGSNIALNGINWKKGDNVIIDEIEYPTDFFILNNLKKKGIEVRIARLKNGAVPPEAFAALADARTRAIVVTHVSYLNGYRHDLKKLADIIHSYKGYLIVDSAQSIGGIKVDVKKENVDFMSGIPYKWLNGPNGVGFLYVKKDLIPQFEPDRLGWSSTSFKSLHTFENKPLTAEAKRFEYGTLSFEGIYALDAALDYINGIGIEKIEAQNLTNINYLREQLRECGIKFFTPENNKAPIISFFMDNEKELGKKLKEEKIFITARNWRGGQVRISPHFYNNKEDIDIFIKAFKKMI